MSDIRIVRRRGLDPLNNFLQGPVSTLGLAVTCGTRIQHGTLLQQSISRFLNHNWPVIVLYSGHDTALPIRSMYPFINGTKNTISIDHPYYGPLYGMNATQAMSTLVKYGTLSAMATDALDTLLRCLPGLNMPIHIESLRWLAGMDESALEYTLRSSRLPKQQIEDALRTLDGCYVSFGNGIPPITEIRNLIAALSNSLLGQLCCLSSNQTAPGQARPMYEISILDTIQRRGFLAIEVSGAADQSGSLQYLAHELECARASGIPFFLACCNVIIPQGSPLSNVILNNNGNYSLFMSALDLPACLPGTSGSDYWGSVLRKLQQLVVLHCNAPGASRQYSDLFGQYVRTIETYSRGIQHGFFSIFPSFSQATSLKEEQFPIFTQDQLENPQLINGGIFWPEGGSVIHCCRDFALPQDTNWQ